MHVFSVSPSNNSEIKLQQPVGRWRQSTSPPEHEAWWMPKEWAQERRIGAFRNEWSYEQNDRSTRQRAHQIPKNNHNVEKIRTGNFIQI